MKVNELRIGNKLLLLGEICTVECISNLPKCKDMYWIKTKEFIDTKIIHFKPIQLTEDILLKCGFVEQLDNYFLDISQRITLCYFDRNECQFSIFQGGNEIDLKWGAVKYLHQLQNLYFALTGEELTINL